MQNQPAHIHLNHIQMKSLPSEIETINIKAVHLLTIRSKQEWVNKIPRHLPVKESMAEQRIFIDCQGNVLAIGEDFAAAETLGTYPVKVYKLVRVSDVLKSK